MHTRTLLLGALLLGRAAPAAAQQDAMKDGAKPSMMKDQAAGKAMAPHELNADGQGVLLHGHDPVAYFTAGKPVPGVAAYTATHAGGTYRFASAANRDAFVAAPGKYAPQFGGYCAMGVAYGKKFDVDPAAFRIVDGKLYLNKDRKTQEAWLKDVPGRIAQANAKWPSIKGKAAAEL